MKITAISDLHGNRPILPGGDLLIVAGDLTAADSPQQYRLFNEWIEKQEYSKKVVICGNHDKWIASGSLFLSSTDRNFEYLCDSVTEFEYEQEMEEEHKFLGVICYKIKKKLKIYGTPWTRWFEGVNPDCDAFMFRHELDLEKKFDMIPEDTDILISHGPCYRRLDKTLYGDYAGSIALRDRVDYLKGKQLKYHIHGHIHEAYGMEEEAGLKTFNVARMNRAYKPVNNIVNLEI